MTPDVVAQDEDLVIRRMRDDPSDLEAMRRWLNDLPVMEFVHGRDRPFSLEQVKEKYGPRLRDGWPTVACLIEREGRAIGYMQFYRWIDWAQDAEKMGFADDDRAYGIDIWIGEPDLWGRGLGTRAVRAMLRYLFEDHGASAVALCTYSWNERAIRAYEKAGFRKVRLLHESELHEGKLQDEWVMVAMPAG
jgi:aminoglycoside 6'-N-acetyltransferase